MKKYGILAGIGASFAALCCAGIPVALAVLSGIGLGFVINDLILFPMLFLSLGFSFHFMNINRKNYKNSNPFYIAIASAVLILVGIFFRPFIWIGIAGFLGSTAWDFGLIRKCETGEVEK